MGIKRFGDFEKTKGYSDYATLPKGGYVCRIMGAQVCENRIGQYVKVSVDIAEGEYKNFYMTDFEGQQSEDKKWRCNYLLNVPVDDGSEKDGWTKRRFKTFTDALEESNAGYHFDWDESKFKGLLIGGLFNIRESEKNDGSIGSATNLAQVCSVEKIRKGTYKLPDDKILARASGSSSGDGNDEFMKLPEGSDEELPF